MSGVTQDLRFAWRALRRNPGFTWVAAATLALGIGANTAIFSMVNAIVLDPLPFPEPDRLVMVWNRWAGFGLHHSPMAPPDYLERRDQNRTLEGLAAFTMDEWQLAGGGEPMRVRVGRVSASFFDVLGTSPAMGRVFEPQEDAPGQDGVVVLSHGLWKRRFGGDRAVLGRTVKLDGRPRTVIGVMPDRLPLPQIDTELWVPIAFTSEETGPAGATSEWVVAVGRTKPGVSLEAARADLEAITARSRATRDAIYREQGWDVDVSRLRDDRVGPYRATLGFLFGASGFLLLIACANIAHLLLARATARRRELAIRTAIGATAARIGRQLLIESLLLATLGGGAGLLIGIWGSTFLARLGIAGLPRVEGFAVDARVLAFTFAATLLAAVAFGLIPLLAQRREPLVEDLKAGGLGAIGGGRRVRGVLIGAQTALTVMLLVGAALMTRSLVEMLKVDTGFEAGQSLALETQLPQGLYPTDERQLAFYGTLLERLGALPGVRSVGMITALPMTGANSGSSYTVEGAVSPPKSPNTQVRWVEGDYFDAAGLRRIAGRGFSGTGRAAGAEVVVDQRFARLAFPGQDAIGRRVEMFDTVLTVVGVVAPVRDRLAEEEARPIVYVPMALHPGPGMVVVVRGERPGVPSAAAVRRAIRELDPELAVANERPLERVVAEAAAGPRTRTIVFALFAGLALLLAAVGIYGVIAYTVGQRTREIGVRMALGAGAREVLAAVMGPSLRTIGVGAVIGLLGAAALGRFLQSQLFGVAAIDPATYVVVTGVILAVALLACAAPARRAARIDPVEALRFE